MTDAHASPPAGGGLGGALKMPPLRSLSIHVPGDIRGKGRPRFSRRGARPRTYTEAKTVSAETWVKACAIDQVGQPMLLGALAVEARIVVQVPQSWAKKRKLAALAGQERPTGKPDADNTLKLLADALNGIVWKDDAQIVDVRVTKQYGDEPGAWLSVFQILPVAS
jgi:Holliday junction resolvase RusA-like endonuclease